MRMHSYDDEVDQFATAVFDWARRRASEDLTGLELGTPRSAAELAEATGPMITAGGVGPMEALRVFTDVLEPACLSIDHPGFLAFVPQAPTEVAILADLAVSATSIYSGSFLEGGGVVHAENQVLSWLAGLAGFPDTAGGCFVQGGTNGNLSAIVAARQDAERRRGARPPRWTIICGAEAHASVAEMARVADAHVVTVAGDRLTGPAVAAAIDEVGAANVAAVVATAGSTNLGRVDDLAGVSAACREREVWLHVDGAYGLAGLLAPSVRGRFAGLEHADSFIVDPHKWLFAPFDVCALVYRDPAAGRAAHTQHGQYLDVLTESGDWNPSDFGVQLSRRARGMPLWFSLVAHGTDAYAEAIETNLALARRTAELLEASPHLELLEQPELSVVAFTRPGWGEPEYTAWSEARLKDGQCFVVPSKHKGTPILRLCFINPRTTEEQVQAILDTLA